MHRKRSIEMKKLIFIHLYNSVIFVHTIRIIFQDKYVLAAMILLSGVCAWHGLTPFLPIAENDLKSSNRLELGALLFFVAGYVTFNLIFVLRIYMMVSMLVIVCHVQLHLYHQDIYDGQNASYYIMFNFIFIIRMYDG